ncbi:MAG TPA: CoA transferase [Pseudonocardiaceae bacterium]
MTGPPTPDTPDTAGTLAGVRVLDLGWVWAGPLVSSALADLGADVVKVESGRRMDPYRMRGVERRADLGDLRREASPSFHKLNRSKRSITVDLSTEAGRAVFLDLAGTADLVVENFQAGTLDKLGLGWPVLAATNPRLVLLSMSAGGATGRWRNLKAYALVTSALAGYEALVRYPGEPVVGSATFGVADPTVAAFGLLAALAGLTRARRTGRGAHLDMSGVEAVLGVLGLAFLDAGNASEAEAGADIDTGTGTEPVVVELTLRCAGPDAWVAVALSGSEDWRKLAGTGNGTSADWPDWHRLATDPAARREVAARLEKLWTTTMEPDTAAAMLTAIGLAAAPVLSVEQRNARPPWADGMTTIEHPITGPEPAYPSPWGSLLPPRPAPLLGEHTDEVLTEWLDYPASRIDRLRQEGVLR